MSLNQSNSKKVALQQEELSKELYENGYVVLRSFLKNKTLKNLNDFYTESDLFKEVKTKPNYLYLNPDKSWEINELIKNELAESFKSVFKAGKLLGGVYMIKQPGENKEVDFHQDWSLVDETKYISYNLWCPLVDTTTESGALMIIDKSDKAGLPYRSSTFPPLEIKYDEKYERFLKKFTLKAGDAILYKHSMFHGSVNNSLKTDRVAIACGIIPENTSFTYQHWNAANSEIESYEVDEDFYISHIHEVLSGKIPKKYNCIAKTKFSVKPEINEKEFYNKLRNANGLKKFLFFDF